MKRRCKGRLRSSKRMVLWEPRIDCGGVPPTATTSSTSVAAASVAVWVVWSTLSRLDPDRQAQSHLQEAQLSRSDARFLQCTDMALPEPE